MEQTVEDRLRELLGNLPPEDVHTILTFAQLLVEHRRAEQTIRHDIEISDTEHARILCMLNAVAALSVEAGPPVSNREHDRYLCGEN